MADIEILQWYHIGDMDLVERSIIDMKRLGVTHLRTGLSWADFYRDARREGFDAASSFRTGEEWYDWLIPRLGSEFMLLPNINYTPPSIGIVPRTSSPPRRLEDYGDFVGWMIAKYGAYFSEVELWNEPNLPVEWDTNIDHDYRMFSAMITSAADVVHYMGKKAVLGGVAAADTGWLRLMGKYGMLEHIDIVGFHLFPGTWDRDAQWREITAQLEKIILPYTDATLWLTETGASAMRGEDEQVKRFNALQDAPIDRAYWYTLYDLPESCRTTAEILFSQDAPECRSFGILTAEGVPRKLYNHFSTNAFQKSI